MIRGVNGGFMCSGVDSSLALVGGVALVGGGTLCGRLSVVGVTGKNAPPYQNAANTSCGGASWHNSASAERLGVMGNQRRRAQV